MSEVNCASCANHLFDPMWGIYKCKRFQRTCTKSEVEMGCDKYEKIGTKPKDPEPEIVVRSGATYTPHVTDNGILSWTNDKGLTNPKYVNLKGPKGDTGPQGIQGPKGDNAPVKGVDYFDGEKGEKGEKGDIGPQGPKGEKGDKGDTGLQGPQGEKGDKGDRGYTGERGPKGETGSKGPRGDVGPKGDKGERGETGPQGPRGYTGSKGEKGDKGEQGPRGYTGATGPQGPKGDKGDPGVMGELTDEDKQAIIDSILQTMNVPTSAKIGEVTLLASAWEGGNNLYSQVVTIDGVTANSQVDLTPDVDQLVIFYEKDLTFVTENDGGVVTVYAIGQKPTNDYTIQVTITEVDI